jgi:replicative DNA helicase
MMNKERVEVHEPQVLNMREVFIEAIKELGKPFPAIQIGSWEYFNRMTGGFRVREFSILCGSTGSGKTTWLANASAHLLQTKVKHFVMSVETGHTDFMKRVLSALAGEDLNTGEVVSAEKLANLSVKYLETIQSGAIEFSLYENRVPVEQLISDLRHMEKMGCKVAMIDNLNFFMEVTRAVDQVIEMDRVIHELIILCKQIDMHVIMVMHPKKTDNGRVESEFDIKGSSTAVQEAHNVFLFNRPKQEDISANSRDPSQRELKLAKMRRRGNHVGKSILYSNNGTQYVEVGFV